MLQMIKDQACRFSPSAIKNFITRKRDDRGSERYRKAGIAASTSFLSKALTVIISFVSVPLTIGYLGTERYGVWLTLSSILTWIALTDFGLTGNALVNVIAEADGKDDRALAREYSSSAFWSLVIISSILAIILAFSFHLIPWRAVFRVSSAMTTGELNTACLLTLAVFVCTLPLNLTSSIYSAYQDGYVHNFWTIGSNVAAVTGLILVTHFRGGLPALIVATYGTRVLVNCANFVYIFAKRYPWVRPSVSAVRWVCVRRLFTLGGKYIVTQFASLAVYQSQPLIITQMLGPAAVAIFVVAYKIVAAPVDLAYIATTPFISAFAEARARNDWPWIRSALKNCLLVSIALGAPLSVVLALTAKYFIRLLAGASAVPSWSVISWLAFYTFLGVAFMAAGQALCGLEKVGILAVVQAVYAVFTVAFSIVGVHYWGLTGLAIGMCLAKILTYCPALLQQALLILRSKTVLESSEPAPVVLTL